MSAVRIPVVWHDDVLRHDAGGELFVGVMTPGTETAERATLVRDACLEAGAPLVAATPHPATVLERVHAADFLHWLESAWTGWVAAGLIGDPGARRVVPYLFATEGLLAGMTPRLPTAVHARTGLFCYDTMTLIGPGTWTAARAAVDAALTAVDVVVGGSAAAFAICRPPGHHAGPASYGGSCYLNNAAVAAEALRAAGHARVCVLDIDAHHGNGTQSIFYDRADVLYASLHVDPGAGWFPHYLGFADEAGVGSGLGANLNLPLAPGSGDGRWLQALDRVCAAVRAHRSTAVVLSLGVDAGAEDPESPLQVTATGFAEAGGMLAGLGLPTVLVLEGGYHLAGLGALVTGVLSAY
ncbi:MAG: histone deacetylase family protein [Geodermatophilaceae bacterium]|nr:histone deacetylase family protein [Geodermatophilaceae bacterium]